MEAGVIAALQERVRGNEQRVEANHNSVVDLRGKQADQDVRVAVISNELEDIRDDLGEIKGQLKWVLRGLWAGAATFLMFAVALAGVLGHG